MESLLSSQFALVFVFGSAMVAYLGLEAARFRVLLRDAVDPSIRASASKHSEPLSFTFPSLYAFFRDLSALGFILLFAFMCEKHPFYAQGAKEWDRDMYWFLTLLLLVASLLTLKKGKSTDILNRDQTEEWKGWMQFMFLFYHYYHAEEVYNAIRVMITCYVWMTGFGNFSFFYIKQDFGFVRFAQMIWRLNFLVVLLMMSQGNTYILYYICPLHTFYFCLVFLTMRLARHQNHGKWNIRVKLFAVAMTIYLVWDCFSGQAFAGAFRLVLPTLPTIGAKSGTLWEWYFRSGLDHWSTFLGMIFALNFPLATRWLTKVEEQPFLSQLTIKSVASGLISIPFLWWAFRVFPQPKISYNHTNAYSAFIPLLTYVFFRNLTPTLRICYSSILHDIGKVTLETYLMQHHIWLTSNAKTLLVFLPNYPKCNLVLTTVVFVFVSRQLYYITMSLRGMVLPDDRRRCIAGAIGLLCGLGAVYALGWTFHLLDLGFTTAAGVATCAGLTLLGVIHKTLNLHLWGSRPGPSGSGGLSGIRGATSSPDSTISIGRILSTILGVACLLSLPIRDARRGSVKMPQAGAESRGNNIASSAIESTEQPLLQATKTALAGNSSACLRLVNHGSWKGSREWLWSKSAVEQCGFRLLSTAEIRSMYRGKNIMVAGDSAGRKVYYELLTALGHPSAAAHNESMPKHVDLHYVDPEAASGIKASFLWRPFVSDIADQAAAWEMAEHAQAFHTDVLLLSFGAWDTLQGTSAHNIKDGLSRLSTQLSSYAGSKPFRAYLVPTTVVDSKLGSEKKEKMKESDVARTREAIAASSFFSHIDVVLDGPEVSVGQAERNVDGVHYDDALYGALVQIMANAQSITSQGGPKVVEPDGGKGTRGLVGMGKVAELQTGIVEPAEEKRDLQSERKGKAIDGSMSSPFYGAIMLLIIALMLVLMDNYAGISWLALQVGRSGMKITWQETYDPLLRKILGTAPTTEARNGAESRENRGRYTPVPQEVEIVELGEDSGPSPPEAEEALMASRHR